MNLKTENFRQSLRQRKFRQLKEKCIELILFLCALSSVVVTGSIIYSLFSESISFFFNCIDQGILNQY